MSRTLRNRAGLVVTGLVFGATLHLIGFSNWDEVHGMFTFASLRLTFAFATAVVLLAISWRVIHAATGATWTHRNIHKGTLVGGILFGVGWAVSGACPSIALVQLGEGQLGALATLAGVFLGNWLYSIVHERYFGWTTGSCVDD
jgi:hypothetical protein